MNHFSRCSNCTNGNSDRTLSTWSKGLLFFRFKASSKFLSHMKTYQMLISDVCVSFYHTSSYYFSTNMFIAIFISKSILFRSYRTQVFFTQDFSKYLVTLRTCAQKNDHLKNSEHLISNLD